MDSRTPSNEVIEKAAARWKSAAGAGILGIAQGHSSNADGMTRALQGINTAQTIIMPMLDGDHVAEPLTKADVIVSGGTRLHGSIYDQLGCRMILRPYVGYDDINVVDATDRGILVCNVPDAYSEEVAMQAIAFLMAANRQLVAFDRAAREGSWRSRMGHGDIVIHNSKAQTVGVIGFGRIGRISGTRAKALGFNVVAYDPYVTQDEVAELGIPLLPLEEVLRQADYVTVHAFLWDETRHMLGAEQFAQMKQGAWIINTARGPIIDEAAMIAALQSGHLAGAGLDVFEVEPIEQDNPLLSMPNVMVAPHIAVYSEEGILRSQARAVEIATAGLTGVLPPRVAATNKGLYDALAERLQG